MFKKLLSYFVPVNIYSRNSDVSKKLEITWNNGQLVLDSQNTNYSFGSLQRILRKGLLNIGTERIIAMRQVLVLGVAGGSVIRTLIDEFRYDGKITGVDIDAAVIEIANTYFGLDKIPNLELVIDDAFEFVLKTRVKYDLIIIDVFKDTEMPNFLFEAFFVNRIAFLLNQNGFFLFNTMTLNNSHDQRNKEYLDQFDADLFDVRTIPRVENHNELIVVRKR